MQNENDRQRMQQTIALAAHVSDEATGLVKVLGLRLESAEERRDLEVHAERARNLYGLVCGMAGVHVAQDLREVQKQLTLTSLAVLTTAEFPLGGDYMAEAKLLGDADDGRALVVHVEVKSSSDRFRAVWFSSDYEETKAIVEYVTRLLDDAWSKFEPGMIAKIGHLAMCVHNMAWRIRYQQQRTAEA